MELFRGKDKQSSEPRTFTYIPEDFGMFAIFKRLYIEGHNI